MDTKELLVEILVEELPALPFLKELPHIKNKWEQACQKYDLSSQAQVFYTPRRIVIVDSSFPTTTQDKKEEFFGPPTSIAYIDGDSNKGLSSAGEAFCRKAQANSKELKVIQKDKKEILYFSRQIQGVLAEKILAEVILDFLSSLNFGKSMRWGCVRESFIRPIRNICIIFDNKDIEMNAYGFVAKKATKIHMDKSFDWKEVYNIQHYFETLQKGCVILSQLGRKTKILEEITMIEKQKNIQVQIDDKLLDEIVAITEYPRALYGEFEEKFLEIPKEAIITSMKENQRYFATKKNEKLHHGFIVVSNSTATDTQKIILGNQKVLRARLYDAMFFYQNDLKSGLNPQKLQEVSFVEGLGSLKDKVEREKKIALFLTQKYQDFLNMPLLEANRMMQDTIELSKADLLSEMVYEFPELQGLMGYYYTKAQKKEDIVCLAIKEQYLPTGEDSALPSNVFSSIVAMSNKLDNIFSLFSIGKIPTGSKDPFGLRRASTGVIKIVLEYQIPFDLKSDIEMIFKTVGYKPFDIGLIESFFIERFEGIVSVNPSILRSVLNAKEYEINNIVLKTKALSAFFEKSDKEAFVSTFKRVANITKDIKEIGKVDTSLFNQPQESKLYEAYKEIKEKSFNNIDEEIRALFSLKEPLDEFFDNVMVNDNNETIKQNRKNLIFGIYQEFLQVGDIKEIGF